MRAYLIFFCLLFAADNLSAQDKCKLIIEKDEFTGTKNIETRQIEIMDYMPLLSNATAWDIKLSFNIVKDSIYVICIEHHSQGNGSFIDKIFLKFSDESVMIKDKQIRGKRINGDVYSSAYTFFKISKEEFQVFGKLPLDKVRVEFHPTDPLYENVVKAKKSKALMEEANCILKEIK